MFGQQPPSQNPPGNAGNSFGGSVGGQGMAPVLGGPPVNSFQAAAATPLSTNPFQMTSATPPPSNLFAPTTPVNQMRPGMGSSVTPTGFASPAFGAASTAIQPPTNHPSGTISTSSSNVFGSTSTFGASSGFGQTTTSVPSLFGTGNSSQATFGNNSSAMPATTKPSTFGTVGNTSNASTFGMPAPKFGQTFTGSVESKPMFGQSLTPTTNTPLFGQSGGSSTSGSAGFGVPPTTTSGLFASAFGQPATPTTTAAFGQPATASNTATFGQPATASNTATFGQPATASNTAAFGQPATASNTAAFGQPATASNTAAFGQPATASNTAAFGQPATASNTAAFGQPATASNTAAFGQPATVSNTASFGQPATASNTATFGQPASIAPLMFKPVTVPSSNPLIPTTVTQSVSFPRSQGTVIFGAPKETTFGARKETMFGGTVDGSGGSHFPASAPLFGTRKPDTAPKEKETLPSKSTTNTFTGSVFGGKPSTGEKPPKFGSIPAAGNTFGKLPAYTETQSVFGAAGSDASKPAPLFGKPQGKGSTEEGSSSGQPAAASAVLFGGHTSSDKDPPTSRSTFWKPKPDASKSKEDAEPKPALFGQSSTAKGSEDAPGPSMPRTLFAGPATESKDEGGTAAPSIQRKLFGKVVSSSGDRSRSVSPLLRGQRRPSPALDAVQDVASEEKELEVKPAEQRLRRQSSTLQDVSDRISIICKEVHRSVNTRTLLRDHFSKYGEVTKVFPNVPRSSATIHFSNHEGATEAKRRGRHIRKDLAPIQIFWSAKTPTKGAPSAVESRSSLPARMRLGARATPDPLDDELSSMRGTADVSGEDFHPLERPEAVRKGKPARDDQWVKGSQSLGSLPARKPAAAERPRRSDPRETTRARSKEPKGLIVKPPSISKPQQGASHITLRGLSNVSGSHAEEKYEILNNRDKILKIAQGTSKTHAVLETARAVRGACPDMCPEKERYMREYRHILSIYEMIPGTELVDHARAVKEYSRSSADQDMPLPLELRPPAVLDRTMDYLLRTVANQGEDGRWSDWFDFMWNRTRAIRKDITQQHLCDLSAVGLTERCARFHIHCSHRLCEEDSLAFDSRINDENFTKCLQTLKELYQDMESKHSTICPHEVEFRAYLVLMNLNEGDILREVQQLREEVREAPEMKFVVRVYSALNSNNYIRFFNLVRRAPYLHACIMHRYFLQVRRRALLVMLKCYGVGNNPTQPISELVRLLAFEDDEEALGFCTHHGLSVSGGEVLMDRSSYITPEAAPDTCRAVKLIESKLTSTVGEAINGEPLPPDPEHVPQLSFDENGRFKDQDLMVAQQPEEEEKEVELSPKPRPQPVEPTPAGFATGMFKPIPEKPPSPAALEGAPIAEPSATNQQPPKLGYSNESIKDVARELFHEVIDEFSRSLSEGMVSSINLYIHVDQLLDDATSDLAREVCEEVHREENQQAAEQQARARAQDAAQRNAACVSVLGLISAEVSDELAHQVAVEEHRLVHEQLLGESEARSSLVVTDALVEEVLQQQVEAVATAVHHSDVKLRLQQLADAESAVVLARTAGYLRRWKNRYAGRLRLKRSMLTFPSNPSLEPITNQLAELVPESQGISQNALHLGAGAMATLASATEVVQESNRLRWDMVLYRRWHQLREQRAWAPLDLPALVAGSRPPQQSSTPAMWRSNTADDIYWKLVISLPEGSAEPSGKAGSQCDWLKAKFRKGAVPNPDPSGKTEVLSLYTGRSPADMAVHGGVGVCVRAVKGVLDEDDVEYFSEKRHLLATSGILMFVDGHHADEDEDRDEEEGIVLDEAHDRLLQLTETLLPPGDCSAPPGECRLPLAVIVSSTVDVEYLKEDLQREVECNPLLGDMTVISLCKDLEDAAASKAVSGAVEWLAARCPPPPQLTSTPIRVFVEEVLGDEFFGPVYTNLAERRRQGQQDQSPELMLGLYNTLVEHLCETASHPRLLHLSWPVPEFSTSDGMLPAVDWNTSAQLNYLQESLAMLQLPDLVLPPTGDWETMHSALLEYIATVCDDTHSNTAFLARVRWLLCKARAEREDADPLDLSDSPDEVCVPWTDLICACINYKLQTLDCSDPTSDEEDGELVIHYETAIRRGFTPPPQWLTACLPPVPLGSFMVETSVLQKSRGSKRKLDETVLPRQPAPLKLPCTTRRVAQTRTLPTRCTHSNLPPKLNLQKVGQDKLEADQSAHDLKNLVAHEKKRTADFEDYLKSVLDETASSPTSDFQQCFGSPEPYTAVSRKRLSSSGHHSLNNVTGFGLKAPSPLVSSAYLASTSLTEDRSFLSLAKRSKQGLLLVESNLDISSNPRENVGDLSVLENVGLLNDTINSEKQADRLFEMRLKSYLID